MTEEEARELRRALSVVAVSGDKRFEGG